MKHERSNIRLEGTHPTRHQKAWRKAVRVTEATGVFTKDIKYDVIFEILSLLHGLIML